MNLNLLCLLFMSMLVGCATPTISSPASPPVATPRPTRTASPEPFYPTVAEMNAEIDAVVSCALPCWHSIQIGTSTYEEVENLLNQDEDFAISSTTLSSINTDYFYVSEQGIEEGYATFDFRRYISESKPIVTNINLYGIPQRTLAEWIDLLGEPSYAYGDIGTNAHYVQPKDWTLWIVWIDKGIELRDSGLEPNPILEADLFFGSEMTLFEPSMMGYRVSSHTPEDILIPWIGYGSSEQYLINTEE